MKNNICLLLVVALSCLTACTKSDSYRISGETKIDRLMGDTLYLQVFTSKGLQAIDSCVVKNSTFSFAGKRDSVEMAVITLKGHALMPVVLDGLEIKACVSDPLSKVGGSAMNDSLYSFVCSKNQIDSLLSVQQRHLSTLIMDGVDYDEAIAIVAKETSRLSELSERMTIQFIKRNIGNPLGTGVFAFVTADYPYPALTPQIEEILIDAGSYFKNNAYVKSYIEIAEDNMVRIRAEKEPIRM